MYLALVPRQTNDSALFSRFEQHHCDVFEVKIHTFLGLVCCVAAEVFTNDAVPMRSPFIVQVLLDFLQRKDTGKQLLQWAR